MAACDQKWVVRMRRPDRHDVPRLDPEFWYPADRLEHLLHPDPLGSGAVRPRLSPDVRPPTLECSWAAVSVYRPRGERPLRAVPNTRPAPVSRPELRHHLDLLTDAFMIRQLRPYHANLRKRQVKSPKVYVRDTGLLHQLLGIDSLKGLLTHPKVGASWEGLVIEQILATEPHDEAFFWATHQSAEIDLVLRRGDELIGVECKRTDAPRLTRSIGVALADLRLTRVSVVYPGTKRLPMSERVEAVPLSVLGRGMGILP